jgi:hypothetical protein
MHETCRHFNTKAQGAASIAHRKPTKLIFSSTGELERCAALTPLASEE